MYTHVHDHLQPANVGWLSLSKWSLLHQAAVKSSPGLLRFLLLQLPLCDSCNQTSL